MNDGINKYIDRFDPVIYQEYEAKKAEIIKVKATLEEQYQYVNEMNLQIKENDAAYVLTKKQLTILITDAEQYTETELDHQLKFIGEEQKRLKMLNDQLITEYKVILHEIENNETNVKLLNDNILKLQAELKANIKKK